MNKNKILFLQKSIAIIDVLLTIDAFFVAFYIRNVFFVDKYGLMSYISKYSWILIAIIPVWLAMFHIFNLYNVAAKENFLKIILKSAFAVGSGIIVISSMLYFQKDLAVSRLFIIIFCSVDFLLIIFFRLILRFVLHFYYSRKKSCTNVLVIGTNSMATKFTEYIKSNPHLMINIIGYLQAGDKVHSTELGIMGRIDDLSNVLVENVVDEVVFALPRDYEGEVGRYVVECKKKGVTVNMIADLFDFTTSNVKLHTIGSLPVITLHTVPFCSWQLFLKRVTDVIGATIGLIITAIAFIFVAPAILIESPGPIFFCQKRVGKNGRVFKCFKFRSMYMDAEARKAELTKFNQMNGAMFKIKNDPRITKVGKFIRAISIDELPQFWNVLKGDMSLVGTRPPTLDEVEKYETYHWKRLSIKPGITGIWQTSGRNKVDNFEDIVRMDSEYIDNWNIGLDMKLIFKTLHIVLARDGAY